MNSIRIKNARENNLKNISLEIPLNRLVLLTGVSGSGKTSLAYDVIFKEGHGRFLESLSSNTRQYLSRINRPDVDEIKGLPPALSVDQKTLVKNARSTVGTMSGIWDLLRLLFARLGTQSKNIAPLKQQRRLFSFNTSYGACPHCRGLGMEEVIDPQRIIKDPNLSLRDGALVITQPNGYTVYSQVTIDVMDRVCRSEGFNVDIPWKDLSEAQKHIVWYGSDKIKIPFGKHSLESRMKWSGITAKPREEGYYKGIIPIMEDILRRDRNANILRFVKSQECSKCYGQRLNEQALSILFDGKNIAHFHQMSIAELDHYFRNYKSGNPVFQSIRNEILETTEMLMELGLSYLNLNRESGTLSGGEAQRIRLINQVQSRLSGLLYVFDEPSIGMHSRDQMKLLKLMRRLVDNGNTVLLIEHEAAFIPAVDHIIDIGPLAGKEGGELIFNGSSRDFLRQEITNSLTQQYYFRELEQNHRQIIQTDGDEAKFLRIENANIHNLKNIDVDFKTATLNVVCGVSGSGKSSLVMDTLAASFTGESKNYISSGRELFQQLIAIDQSPIGRTPRSNPATYTKLFDAIRKLFASQDTAKEKGLGKSHFSFNVKGGRCEACQGAGYRQIGMHFIGNVEIRCEFCNGKRFQKEILEVKYSGKNIFEVLEMRIDDALDFFAGEKDIVRILTALHDLGLGYLQLGQRATTLSGGEAQRVKLATEISRKTKGKTLYILDEPTTGLHAYDVEILLKALEKIRQQGHTIIVIEHHHELIRNAGHIIELGPESGEEGGRVVFRGSYDELIKKDTLTAKALRGEFDSGLRRQSKTSPNNEIILEGVRTHKLKNISLKTPKNSLTVISGVSGSGKSSLAFDTLAAEGRMQFLQSLPNYVRGRINGNSQADFDRISGLTPAIAIDGKTRNTSPRATLGTMTDIYDLLRLMYSRIGRYDSGEVCQLESSAFSFNNQDAACEHCKGLGEITTTDPQKLISHPGCSILAGAMDGSKTGKFYGDPNGQYVWTLKALDKELGLLLELPWEKLPEESQKIVMYGMLDIELEVEWKFTRKGRSGSHRFKTRWQGFVALIDEEYERKQADKRGEAMRDILKEVSCPQCHGARLRPEALDIKIEGLNIAEISRKSVSECLQTIENWEHHLHAEDLQITADIRRELGARLQGLANMELEYLQIDRKAATLSGGEMQRLKIAGHIYGAMSGITYVLDEPSIGLHPKNTQKLLHELRKLQHAGNTLVLVEHDPEIIRAADYLVIMGPGAGEQGGEIVAAGKGRDVLQKYPLETKAPEKVPPEKLKAEGILSIQGAYAHNLKNIDLEIKTNRLVGIAGVSGSGKSSLLTDVIHASAKAGKAIHCTSIKGLEHFSETLYISPQADKAHSNSIVCSFLEIFDPIRKLYVANAKKQGISVKPALFSFNSKEGRCPECKGAGYISTGMDFLSDIREQCPECQGSRYKKETLEFKLQDKDIAALLEMSIGEANTFLREAGKKTFEVLELAEVAGLEYLLLGQSMDSISGGEMQRLKLIKQLSKSRQSADKPGLYLLDEPSRGLSYKDIIKLYSILKQLVEEGHSVLMIEHNPLLLQACHQLIELGPAGGEKGGYLLD